MFFTGAFSLNGMTVQKAHSETDNCNDDVISRLDEIGELFFSFMDGYVTNIGNEVTIHIKPEHNTTANINYIKGIFGLAEKYGVSKIAVEELV